MTLHGLQAIESRLQRFDPARYSLHRLADAQEFDEYEALMRSAYDPLGFMCEQVLPNAQSQCFKLLHGDELSAIFRLTPIAEGSIYHQLIPRREWSEDVRRFIEVNNVVVADQFRATIVLGLLLKHCARIAAEQAFEAVVGLTRYQTLHHFVDFGVMPIDHQPLHLLGRTDILDFVIYYDVTTNDARRYMEERASHYFQQRYIMAAIREKYVRRTERPFRRRDEAVSHDIGTASA